MLSHLFTAPAGAVRPVSAPNAVKAMTLIAHLFSRRSSPSPEHPSSALKPIPKANPKNQTYLMSRSAFE
jgi:hypothetical protein